jgi:hypothetical protein
VSESEQARSAEVYVLAMSIGPIAVGSDLDTLKRRAEKEEKENASEFKWERDEWTGWTERLLLKYVSKSTGRWNKSRYFIDKVPVLDAEGPQ